MDIFLIILAALLILIWLFGRNDSQISQKPEYTILSQIFEPTPQTRRIEEPSQKQKIDAYFIALRFAKNSVESEMLEARLYSELSKAQSPSVNLLMREAASLEEKGDMRRALEVYSEAIKLEPQFSESYSHGASIAYRLGDKELAKNWIKTATIIEPRHFAAWFGLGTIYEEEGDLKKAREAFANAYYFNPNLLEAKRAIFRIDAKTKGIDF